METINFFNIIDELPKTNPGLYRNLEVFEYTIAVKKRLLSIPREGMKELVAYMVDIGYFTSAGSTRFHGNYKGGLISHSVNLYKLYNKLLEQSEVEFDDNSQFLCAILHDLCKAGAYIENGINYKWNPSQPSGHALLSLERIKKFIKLTDTEEKIIKYHMGMYGTVEFNEKGEYILKELVGAFNNRIVKLFYFCDDIVSQFVDKKKG